MKKFSKLKNNKEKLEFVLKYYYVHNNGDIKYRPDSESFWDLNEAIKYSVKNYRPSLYRLYEVSLYKGSDGKMYEESEDLFLLPNLANRSFTDYILAEPREEGNPKYICSYMVYNEADLTKEINLNDNFNKFPNVSLYRIDSSLNDDNISVTVNYTLLREIKKDGKIKKITR